MHRSRTPMCKCTAKDEYLEIYGILKREKYLDDI